MTTRTTASRPLPPVVTRKALPKKPKQVGRDVALEYLRRLEQTYPDAKCSLDYTELGVGIARKGWLEPADVLNTWDAGAIVERARARRARA